MYGTSPQDSAVQKTALWCTQPSLWRRKICPVRITEKKGRSGSPHQRTGAVAGLCIAKSESDSRRGRTSGAAERQRDVADIEAAETPGEGTAGAPAQGHRRMARLASPHQRTGAVAGLCHGKVGKRLERRRGSGIRPVSIVTGLRWRACAASAGGPGICPAQGHRRMA